jgi:hypothetical protein
MKRWVVRSALVAAFAALLGGLATDVQAWTAVPYPSSIGPWGTTVADITLTKSIRARGRRYTSHRVHTQTVFSNGSYDISASAYCSIVGWRTTVTTIPNGTDTTIEAECPSGSFYITGGGAIDAL